MPQIATEQLVALLVGIARSQQAIIDAIESQRPGFKGTHLLSALQSAAHVRDMHRAPTLADLPARVLMQCQSRNGPNYAQLVRELETLLAGGPRPAAADDLDMTKI